MAKYTLSTKQKDALRAVARALNINIESYTKKKIGKNSYTGFEISAFRFKEKNENTSIFEQKTGAWSKKWKRSWNSIPTLSEIKEMAKEDYRIEIKAVDKRLVPKHKKVEVEKERLNKISMDKFFAALDKSKTSSKQTKNVKELVGVENLVSNKVISFTKELYSNNSSEFKEDILKNKIEELPKLIKKAFQSKKDFIDISFYNIDTEDLGYRKEILDMRGTAEQQLSNAYSWCSDKKEREKLRIKADKEDIKDNSWYKKYLRSQVRVYNLIKGNTFTEQVGKIVSDVEECDIYEPQRDSLIYTLNLFMDRNGRIKTSYDSLENDSWSYIPKGYELNTKVKVRFNFAYATNKTKSFITDDRKLKALLKEVSKEETIIQKLKSNISDIY